MVTVKERVKQLYQEAGQEGLANTIIYPNELGDRTGLIYDEKDPGDCPPNPILKFYDGTCLVINRLCNEIPVSQQTYLPGLGFGLRASCFYSTTDPSRGWTGYNACHIQYAGRELTPAELWLPELRQRAIDMGYDIRSCAGYPDGEIGWGFFSTDKSQAIEDWYDFYLKTSIGGGSSRITVPGGYIQAYTMLYIANMDQVTEPYVPPPECEEDQVEVLEYCPAPYQETPKLWKTCVNGKWVQLQQDCPFCEEGQVEVLETCPAPYQETAKVWRTCVDNEWVQLQQDCPVVPPPQPEKQSLIPLIISGSIIAGFLSYMVYEEKIGLYK